MERKIYVVESSESDCCPACSIVGAYIDEAAAKACAADDKSCHVETIPFYGEAKRGAEIFVVEEYSHERIPDLEYVAAYSDKNEVAAAVGTCPATLDSVGFCAVTLE